MAMWYLESRFRNLGSGFRNRERDQESGYRNQGSRIKSGVQGSRQHGSRMLAERYRQKNVPNSKRDRFELARVERVRAAIWREQHESFLA